MKTLIFALAAFLLAPALFAQEAASQENQAQAAPVVVSQAPAQESNSQDNLPPSIRPGHPLDPADVDVLTGKKDREMEASQTAAYPIAVSGYGGYGNYYGIGGWGGGNFGFPFLPLRQIRNPFLFSILRSGGFGRGGFRGGR
jgi:hypothetical protein